MSIDDVNSQIKKIKECFPTAEVQTIQGGIQVLIISSSFIFIMLFLGH